ncbi:hypothetical protein CEP52_008654 [Fusarium oligoseptatum]|uniref:Uncharacterized protein n=1 Tax=Fusarium oligoseptatum TaxID=2604345 RepID=A0A428TGP7_9HYPO|nr:hypothetical protein CEP52_008654 [Fusarium oligoseptatum]
MRLFVEQVGKNSGPGTKGINVTSVYNWLTFDIIGVLTFGESFESVSSWQSSVWVDLLLNMAKHMTFLPAAERLSLPAFALGAVMPSDVSKNAAYHDKLTEEKISRRIGLIKSNDREDFFAFILRKGNFDPVHLREQAKLLMLAGSETTATFLAMVTYLLLKSPVSMQKLQHEVRSAFSSTGINLAYLEARIVLAYMIYAYDWELVNKDLEWFKEVKLWTLWEKPELYVRFHPRDV